MTVKSDLPQGTLELLILKVVALGPVHGYAIAQRLQHVSRFVVRAPQGSLYPALHRQLEVPGGHMLIHVGDFTFYSKPPSIVSDFND